MNKIRLCKYLLLFIIFIQSYIFCFSRYNYQKKGYNIAKSALSQDVTSECTGFTIKFNVSDEPISNMVDQISKRRYAMHLIGSIIEKLSPKYIGLYPKIWIKC